MRMTYTELEVITCKKLIFLTLINRDVLQTGLLLNRDLYSEALRK